MELCPAQQSPPSAIWATSLEQDFPNLLSSGKQSGTVFKNESSEARLPGLVSCPTTDDLCDLGHVT